MTDERPIFVPGLGAPLEIEDPSILRFQPQPSFKEHLEAKLRLIRTMCKTDVAMARALGVIPHTIYRWRKGQDYPSADTQRVIDQTYAVALERLYVQANKRFIYQRRNLRRRAAKQPEAAQNSVDQVY